jgi:acyl-coenzyme A thioesterase PaaI-like protein
MRANTHLALNARLCGTPISLEPSAAAVELVTREEMAADARGLVHGGFVFGLADYAAMLAINEPNVVLGAAEVRFLAPVTVGETLTARARSAAPDGKKLRVTVEVTRGEEPVFSGSFVCFVPGQHVLDARQAQR